MKATSPRVDRESPFYVPPFLDFLGTGVQRFPRFFRWLGDLESSQLAEELRPVRVKMPIYVCGLARSGSTLLHEIICSCTGVATHRVKDFPMVHTPCWWRRAAANFQPGAAHERPHRDRLLITPESPDAIEEMLWMVFFPWSHDASVSHVLSAGDRHRAFEAYYSTHLRKLMLAEGAARYAAKNNYHVGRLAFLARLFPDARFVIPVRPRPATSPR